MIEDYRFRYACEHYCTAQQLLRNAAPSTICPKVIFSQAVPPSSSLPDILIYRTRPAVTRIFLCQWAQVLQKYRALFHHLVLRRAMRSKQTTITFINLIRAPGWSSTTGDMADSSGTEPYEYKVRYVHWHRNAFFDQIPTTSPDDISHELAACFTVPSTPSG